MNIITRLAVYLSEHLSFEYDKIISSCEKVRPDIKLKKKLGDYSVVLRKFCRGDRYNELVKEIEDHHVIPGGIITKLVVIRGKLNIYINKSTMLREIMGSMLREMMGLIWVQKSAFGSHNQGKGKNVLIEYSSPNIAKPFHVGHLRSTILGQFLSNLYRYTGHGVKSINYLGDWGKQFGIIGYGLESNNISLQDLKRVKNPISILSEVYVVMNNNIKYEKKWFLQCKGIESERIAKEQGINVISKTNEGSKRYSEQLETDFRNGNQSDQIELWKYTREKSIERFRKIYQRLGVSFDVYSGESFYCRYGIPPGLEAVTVITENNPAYVDLGELGKFGLLKPDGSSLYSLRDINAALDRNKVYDFDKMLYVVATEQEEYFKQLIATLGLVDQDLSDKCEHIGFGMVLGMSTRKGNVVLLEDILNTSKEKMKEKILKNEEDEKEKGKEGRVKDIDKTAEILGKSAIIIQDFKASRIKNYKFEWSRATNFAGETGPYLQYSHVRLFNIIEKAKENGLYVSDENVESILSHIEENLNEEEALDLVLEFSEFPTIIDKCLQRNEAQPLLTWLFRFIKLVFNAYGKLTVIKCENKEKAMARLFMFVCSKVIIKTSLQLMGLDPLEKM